MAHFSNLLLITLFIHTPRLSLFLSLAPAAYAVVEMNKGVYQEFLNVCFIPPNTLTFPCLLFVASEFSVFTDCMKKNMNLLWMNW